MSEALIVALCLLGGLWTAFWVIRLAVRYGVNDALKLEADRRWHADRYKGPQPR